MYTNTPFNNGMAQKPNYSFLNVDPFPFTNANLDDPLNMPSMDEDDCYDPNPSLSKKPLSKDERRAEHNAIERARRESLNNKFQQLAQALPNLMNYRRPSKSQIVEKALDWVKKSISREERYRYQIVQLQKENKQLLAQLMTNNGPSTTTPNVTSPSISPSASVSTPITTANNHTTDFTSNKHYSQQQQQQHHHHQPYSPHTSVSSPTQASPLNSFHQHHSFSDLDTSITAHTTTPATTPSALQSPFLYDLTPSSLLTSRSPPASLSTPHIFSSLDDLHHTPSYDRKELDPALNQSPDMYESMLLSNHRVPTFIQPMASRSTPAFSSSRKR